MQSDTIKLGLKKLRRRQGKFRLSIVSLISFLFAVESLLFFQIFLHFVFKKKCVFSSFSSFRFFFILYSKRNVSVFYEMARQLKDYQSKGVDWLYANYEEGHGSILADEMGLGKTFQVSSRERFPVLVIHN